MRRFKFGALLAGLAASVPTVASAQQPDVGAMFSVALAEFSRQEAVVQVLTTPRCESDGRPVACAEASAQAVLRNHAASLGAEIVSADTDFPTCPDTDQVGNEVRGPVGHRLFVTGPTPEARRQIVGVEIECQYTDSTLGAFRLTLQLPFEQVDGEWVRRELGLYLVGH